MNFYKTWQGIKSETTCSFTVLPSSHQPQSLSETSSPLCAAPPPPLLHDNGTGSSPGNGLFMSCVIKKMYSRLIACPLSSHLCFCTKPADEQQRERVPAPTSSQIPHQLLFVKVSSRGIPLESWGNRLGSVSLLVVLMVCLSSHSLLSFNVFFNLTHLRT